MSRRLSYGTGMILVLTAGVLWSFQGIFVRQVTEAGPWTVLFWRSLGMLPMTFALLVWRSGGSPFRAIRKAGIAGALGGLGLVAAMGGAILSFQTTTIANAEFLFAAAPVRAAVLGRLILRERVTPQTWIAIGVALVGILVMVRGGLAGGAWLGNLAAFISAFGFAAFTVTLRWRHLDDSLPSTVLGAAFSVLAGAAIAIRTGQPLAAPPMDIFWCLAMGMFTLAGGMFLYTLGSRVVPSGELALLSNTEVMLAPLWAWLLLGETASAATFVGGAIVLTAIVFNGLVGVRRLARA